MKYWKNVSSSGWNVGDRGSPADYEITSLQDWKMVQKDKITASRYEREVGGVLLGDTMLDTDRETQTRIAQAKVLVDNEPSLIIKWKKANGEWVELNHETITAMSLAIGNHVQKCFAQEADLHYLIDLCETIDDVLSISWEDPK